MLEKSLSDILNSSHDHHNNISLWIEQNIEQQEALHEVLAAIHQSPKYFHIAINYAEESIRRWNYIHPKILNSLEFIFTNFQKLSEENATITDFLRIGGGKLLHNNHILQKISSIDVEKIHPTLQLRLIENFQNDFHHNLLLSNHTTWYQNMVKKMAEIHPEWIQNLISHKPQDLFEKFGFSLIEGYHLFFQITQTHGVFTQADVNEMAYLRRLWGEKILETLKEMNIDDFYNFIHRFADKNHSNAINFLAFNNLQDLSKEKRFYLSLLYENRIFDESENDEFLEYILIHIEKNRGEIFEKNNFKKIDEILQFLSAESISILGNGQMFMRFVNIIQKNDWYISLFHQYLKSLSQKQNFLNDRQIILLLQSIKIQNHTLSNHFYTFIIWEILKFHSLKTFINIEDRFSILSHSQEIHDIKSAIFSITMKQFTELSYAQSEAFLMIIIKKMNLNEYGIIDFLDIFSKWSGKMKYMTMRVARKNHLDIASSQFKTIRERCFFHASFPLRYIHWFALTLGK